MAASAIWNCCSLPSVQGTESTNPLTTHCRNPKRMEQVAREHLPNQWVVKVLLLPNLEVNLKRNATRTNKPFDPSELEETIRSTSVSYRDGAPEGWICIDNSEMTVDETVERIIGLKD